MAKAANDMRTFINRIRNVATALIAGADQYGAGLAEHGRKPPTVAVNHFYRTFNGSVVMVVSEILPTPCQCPFCTIRRQMGNVVGISETSEADHETSPRCFRVVVIRGGHGVTDADGEEPGECYAVGEDGVFVGLPEQLSGNVKTDIIGFRLLALAGMNLAREHEAHIED